MYAFAPGNVLQMVNYLFNDYRYNLLDYWRLSIESMSILDGWIRQLQSASIPQPAGNSGDKPTKPIHQFPEIIWTMYDYVSILESRKTIFCLFLLGLVPLMLFLS